LFTERSGVLHRALMKDLTNHKEAAAMQSHPDPSERLIMVPYDARESISIAVAAKLSGKAGNTVRLWANMASGAKLVVTGISAAWRYGCF